MREKKGEKDGRWIKKVPPLSLQQNGGGTGRGGTEETKFCDEKDRTEGEREGGPKSGGKSRLRRRRGQTTPPTPQKWVTEVGRKKDRKGSGISPGKKGFFRPVEKETSLQF